MPHKPDRNLWQPRRRIEQSYASEMYDVIGQQFLPALLRRGLPWMAPGSLDPDIEAIALSIARRMVQSVSVANARSWRQAALLSGRGQLIYRSLQAEMQGRTGQEVRKLIRENAGLILSIPEDLRESTARFVAAQQRKGMRSEMIAEALRSRLPELAKSKIHLIARTETAKAETAFSQVRAENLGIRWYEWATAKDQRVRKSHQKMNEVLVAWANPPAPEALVHERSTLGHYAPGGCPNCRCVAIPLVRLDEVSWPHRVYVRDSIVWMTQVEFARIAGRPMTRAA